MKIEEDQALDAFAALSQATRLQMVRTLVVAGPDHPLRFAGGEEGPHPYLAVRGGLEALVARPVYYELAELALAEACEPPGLWSGGAFFALEPDS